MSNDYNPDWISPPGDTILDIIKESGGSVDFLAEQLNFSDDEINRLLRGVMPITRDLAIKLQNTIGAPVGFWMNREAQYRSELHRLATSKPELVIRQAEVQKLNMKSGEVLVIKLSDGDNAISREDMDSLKRGFESLFPNNKVILLALPDSAKIDLTTVQGSEYPEVSKEPCSVVNYCNDCGCGKKEMAESMGLKKGE